MGVEIARPPANGAGAGPEIGSLAPGESPPHAASATARTKAGTRAPA